ELDPVSPNVLTCPQPLITRLIPVIVVGQASIPGAWRALPTIFNKIGFLGGL
ncbi:hypothetical protein EVA_05482, partial [gut metagenome]